METLKQFLGLLPIIAQLIPAEGRLGSIEELIVQASSELDRRMREGGQTRAEVLKDAAATWDEDLRKAAALALLGHEATAETATAEIATAASEPPEGPRNG